MKTLFIHFNNDGTIKSGNIRVNGKKVPDMALWEVFEFYQILIALGYSPLEMDSPEDGYIHIISY